MCVAALAAVLSGARSSERAVREALRALPHLDQAGRRQAARRIIATGVLRARLAWRARVPIDDAEALFDAYLAHEELGPPLDARPWPADPMERMAAERSAPRFVVDELVRSLGIADADRFLAASNVPGPTTLRVNTARTDRATLITQLRAERIETTPHPTVPTALEVVGHANLFGSAAWRSGLFEVQDASSQAAALLCAVEPGQTVVDLCAGRGGKTLALAAQLAGRGTLHAHDVDPRLVRDLVPRLARAQVELVRFSLPPPGTADVVLVDAPCSSLGPLRRAPDLRWSVTPDAFAALPNLQLQILQTGARLVRPGGRLVYATCTVRREENQSVARAAARELELGLDSEHVFLPHLDGGDGFYVAVFDRP